jgi:hypothetical protein
LKSEFVLDKLDSLLALQVHREQVEVTTTAGPIIYFQSSKDPVFKFM